MRRTQQMLVVSVVLSLAAGNIYGFQIAGSKGRTGRSRLHLSSPSPISGGDVSDDELQTLFELLKDDVVLYDPSRGTCCRNRCSGCTFLDSAGDFVFDEFSASDDEGGWIAPYVQVDFGGRRHVSAWSQLLFPSSGGIEDADEKQKKKQIEKSEFASLLQRACRSSAEDEASLPVSPLSLHALYVTLSPSAGYPRLSSAEIVRSIKGTEGSVYEMGGAVPYTAFRSQMIKSLDQLTSLAASTSSDGNDAGSMAPMDYESMDKEELLSIVNERGMKTNFPKLKRIIIEELRFFDVHGRQGKRHPVKNTLS